MRLPGRAVTGDHLRSWCEIRERVAWREVRHRSGGPDGSVHGRRDGIVHRIATVENARDPLRARRLLVAYERVRADAAAGRTLDFGLLADWQRTVLGVPRAPFRSGVAFAKGGRERYGLDEDTPERFAACLADSREDGVPVASRAARAYLDVCFFHPFSDGNARAALLTLAFVLAEEEIVLDQVGPLVQLRRHADDLDGARGTAELVGTLIDGTRRRRDGTSHAAGG
ncbi:Fic family protein [Actinoallomurus sp. NBC_01490]|uniref:Fic family protein n=1 Tax=Actinoallomurus sp. NBC_01490 TaxID=2903557 RepID=UPI002E315E86|nr:Fic family protein [Actinoallomurus sp. NBC_01490]